MSDIKYPEQIEAAALNLHERQQALRHAKELLDRLELDTLAKVTMATDEKGKPLYSNETQRKLALTALLDEIPRWSELLEIWKKAETDKVIKEAALERLRREHSEYKLAWQDEIATKHAAI